MTPPTSPRPDEDLKEHEGSRPSDRDSLPPDDALRPAETDTKDDASIPPKPTAMYGDAYRKIYLLRPRQLLDVPWEDFIVGREPEPTRPQIETSSELTLIVVPWKDHDINVIAWDIALRDAASSPKWSVWRMKTGKLSPEAAQASAEENGGLTIGRVTTEEGRNRALATLPRLALDKDLWRKNTAQSQRWTNLVIERLHDELGELLEFSRTDVGHAEEGAVLESLPNVSVRRPDDRRLTTAADIILREGFTVADQHLLRERTKWSPKAYPPCTLKLAPRGGVEYFPFTVAAGLSYEYDESCTCAVTLLPGMPPLSDREENQNVRPVSWAVGFVHRKSGLSKTVSIHQRGTTFAHSFQEHGEFSLMRNEWQGGILVAYCDAEDVITGLQNLCRAQKPTFDTRIWATNILKDAAKQGLLVAPDQKSALDAEWIDTLSKYLELALTREVEMTSGESTIEKAQVSHQLAKGAWDLVDERFLQLQRDCQAQAVKHLKRPVQNPQAEEEEDEEDDEDEDEDDAEDEEEDDEHPESSRPEGAIHPHDRYVRGPAEGYSRRSYYTRPTLPAIGDTGQRKGNATSNYTWRPPPYWMQQGQ
ncbi:hypothetical protein EXIGLDRAFT_731861 [Exidia glandulosa HHB12029]|uniref:Uncharacterized protein n=1 Tax=Exidia glandulosa HHB12029 TaxID=1314781 RepID=A0A165KXL6_EXIGL|nr:hypothetical protein EXIGLDRAFT_731861 [Exidia glandulosa HHB12029]